MFEPGNETLLRSRWVAVAFSVVALTRQFRERRGELRVFESFAVADDAPLSVGSLELDTNPGLTELIGRLSHISVAPAGPIAITNNPKISL